MKRQSFGFCAKRAGGSPCCYDVQDHLASATDVEDTVTTYTYSDRDLLTEEISEVSGTTSFVYNEHGELTEETDARLIVTTRVVDALDRVTFVDYPDDTLDITYTYDDPMVPFSSGRLTAIARNGTSIDHGYDRFGRLTQDGTLAYTYDKNGNRSTISYPSGVTTTATYDFADRPATLDAVLPGVGSTAIVTATSYRPAGPVDSLTLGNGIVETRAHDERYHPDRITAGPPMGTALLDWDYTTDDVGNITAIADALVPANDRTYGYLDHQYFLTQGDGPWGTRAWTYDPTGNRITQTSDGATDTYAYVLNAAAGNSPKLMSIALDGGGNEIFAFDDAGNQTQIDSPASVLDSTFDDASRQATTGDGIFEIANRYDGRGFLERSERTNPGAIFADSFESENLACWSDTVGGPSGGTCPVDPPFVAPTYSSDGLLHHMERGFGDDERWVLYHAGRPIAIVEQVGGGTADVTFLTTDHLGTPALATNAAGAEVWEGGFEPFGADFADAEGAGVFLRFPGQWDDVEWRGAGQTYNVHRWYQNGTGRYSRADPLGLAGDAHPYNYANASPIVLVDPSGEKSRVCCTPIAGGLLAFFRHCFIQVQDDPSGTSTTYSLHGMGTEHRAWGGPLGCTFVNDSFDRDALSGPSLGCGDWNTDCAADACVKDEFRDYPRASNYSIFGTNSNTFAGTVSRACKLGGPPLAGTVRTPGWLRQPATAAAGKTCPPRR